MEKEVVVFCTVSDEAQAESIAQTLVEEKLAACCNIVPHLTSVYFWEGKIQKDSEVLLIIKTLSKVYALLEKRIKELHSYQVPEIIALDIKQGNSDYLKWIHQVVKP
ncbi:MAG: divalent-cation tolerance protein CutA [Calditrichaeota bacterium]|nr:divalent-cation tolerance protein CutA [Calditrichota bacterium]